MEKEQNGFKSRAILIISILMAGYHLYFATVGFLTEMTWRAGHLMFAAVLILLSYPITREKSGWRFLDWLTQNVHKAVGRWKFDPGVEVLAPLHPGAAKYYKEKGLM